MAKGRSLFGEMDNNYWLEELSKAKNIDAAIKVVEKCMNATTDGKLNWGVSDQDQKVVMSLLRQLNSTYGIDISEAMRYWDINLNHINSLEVNNATKTAIGSLNRNKPVATTTKDNTIKDDTTNTNSTTSGGGGGSINYYYTAPSDSGLKDEIKSLQEQVKELSKVYSADELAKQYGVENLINNDYVTKLYTDALNEYYDDMVATNTKYRDQYNRNNVSYDNYLRDAYADSYRNAAMTNTSQGAIAANALSSSLNYDYNTTQVDYGMLQNQQELESLRDSSLANVPNEALQDVEKFRQYLMTAGAKHNSSDIQNTGNSIISAANRYSADMNTAAAVAKANAIKFGGLANASNYSNSNNTNNAWYNFYQQALGTSAASTLMTQQLKNNSK